jgi:hypothetical protein
MYRARLGAMHVFCAANGARALLIAAAEFFPIGISADAIWIWIKAVIGANALRPKQQP